VRKELENDSRFVLTREEILSKEEVTRRWNLIPEQTQKRIEKYYISEEKDKVEFLSLMTKWFEEEKGRTLIRSYLLDYLQISEISPTTIGKIRSNWGYEPLQGGVKNHDKTDTSLKTKTHKVVDKVKMKHDYNNVQPNQSRETDTQLFKQLLSSMDHNVLFVCLNVLGVPLAPSTEIKAGDVSIFRETAQTQLSNLKDFYGKNKTKINNILTKRMMKHGTDYSTKDLARVVKALGLDLNFV